MQIEFDTKDFARLQAQLSAIPMEIRTKAWRSAMARVGQRLRRDVVKRSAERLGVKQGTIAKRVEAVPGKDASMELKVSSRWLSAPETSAKRVRQILRHVPRGSYSIAFMAKMKTKHVGVFSRKIGVKMKSNPKKEKIEEYHGPNPASDIANNGEPWVDILAKLMEQDLLPRYLHEINFRLSKLGR